MASNQETISTPFRELEEIKSLAQGQARYAFIIPRLERVKQNMTVAAEPSQNITCSIFDVPEAANMLSQLRESGHYDNNQDVDRLILDSVINELVETFTGKATNTLFGYLKGVCRGFKFLCNTDDKEEQEELHQAIYDDLHGARQFLDEYRSSEWGWVLNKHLVSLMDEFRLGDDVAKSKREKLQQAWVQAVTVECVLDHLGDIFGAIRAIDEC